MWVVKGILFLILLFVLVYFFVTNANQTVDLNVLGRAYLDVSIFWIVIISFLVGFAVAFVLAAVRELRFHHRQRQLRRELAEREQEIADLRTLPLRDLPDGDATLTAEEGGRHDRD